MKPRQVLERSETPDGQSLELVIEGGHHVIRVGGRPLMSSAMYGSEQAMAEIASKLLGGRAKPKILIGGLGMGFTLRAALDVFGKGARVTVAELLPQLVAYNRGPLADLAGRPLEDARVELFEGDVRDCFSTKPWDAILMDVDNGPDAFTVSDNASLYSHRGIRDMAGGLSGSGVLIVWSAGPSEAFERRAKKAGLSVEVRRVHARGEKRKGGRHTLFILRRDRPRRSGGGARG